MFKNFFFQLKNSKHVKFFWGNMLKAFFSQGSGCLCLDGVLEKCEKTTFFISIKIQCFISRMIL